MLRMSAVVVLLGGCATWRGPSADKAGPMMFNFRAGGAVGVYQSNGAPPSRGQSDTAMGSLELGFAVTPDRNGYVLFAPQYQGPGFGGLWEATMFPVGFEYDLKLAEKGPYLTTKIVAGYALVWSLVGNLHFGFAIPELGLKWVLKKRWNIGFTWFSLPVAFGIDDNHAWVAPIFYRASFDVGVNF